MTERRIRFGIQTGQQFARWEEIVAIWQRAEALGYDAAWTYDHFQAVMLDPFDPCLEGWSCLAALAVHTKHIRIGALVTGNTYRHPAILAKIAATVDVISSGRLEFGIGAGWFEPEHQMLGIPFGTASWRCERLDEALHVIRKLWSEHQATFAGKHYQLNAAIAEPKPVQQPHPPITVAGAGEKRMLPIVARHADIWSSFGSPDVFRKRIAVLRRCCDAENRDCDAIRKQVLVPAAITADLSTAAPLIQGYALYQGISDEEARNWMLLGSADDVCRQIDAFVAADVTDFVLTLSPYNMDVFERFAADVLPRYR
ncbi:MAG: LLM class F420-dependent oxidoreductase [Deltaproteobacteria bacterium]|nr:LLM class F420-dependent oxidoreductase [Deltaproteobacteria bacterium]